MCATQLFHRLGPREKNKNCGGNMKKRETGKTRKARKNTREKNPQTPQQGKAITEIIICPCRLPFDHRIP
jgi:hypothetical protein